MAKDKQIDPNNASESVGRSTVSRWNIPNALSVFRLVGSFVLVALAIGGSTGPFVGLLIALLLSDWIDGKLAILWKQQTTFGARIDSLADAAMYAALLFGTCWLKWDFVVGQWPWIVGAIASYILTTAIGLVRFHRIPSYHTRGAKTSWLLISIAAVVVFAGGPAWPFQIAMVGVMVTNLEATIMSLVLSKWTADVPSVYHAWRLRQQHQGAGMPDSVTRGGGGE